MLSHIFSILNSIVWGVPALFLIIGVGIVLTVKTRIAQLRLLPEACRDFIDKIFGKKNKTSGVSSFQALCTALAATVGTGNIAGVAGAIAIGGPGAIFWMWISAFLGMIIKAAEVILAVNYRDRKLNGEFHGGTMYIIRNGLQKKWHWLAGLYAFFGIIAAFGMGNGTQINAVIGSIHSALDGIGISVNKYYDLLIGIFAATSVAILLIGGAKRVGKFAEILIPFAAVAYIVICLGVIIVRVDRFPSAIISIVQGAFTPSAVTGGVVGSTFCALRVGISRGVFTNEAGMGTAAIAHAGADVVSPIQQGLMGIMEVFLDTIIICTMTALAILCSGVTIPYGNDVGVLLTANAFSSIYGSWVNFLLMMFLCLFAFATMLGWGLYGIRCAQYLFGESSCRWLVVLQSVAIVLSTLLDTGTVWMLSETVNGLMVIPNLIMLCILMPKCVKIINDYR